MAWATLDDVIAGMAAGQLRPVYFPSVTTVTGRLTDLNAAGSGRYGQMATPAAASASGTLHVCTETGFPFFTNAAGGNSLRMCLANLAMQTAGAITVYERVWSCSGLDGTVTSAQNVTSFPALTIPDSVGTGLEMFAEVYTQIGASSTTITASYTNSANTSGRTTIAQSIGNTGLREVFRLIPMPLAAGDTGVKSIASATLAGTTSTAGNFGLVLAKRLFSLTQTLAYGAPPSDFAKLGLPLVDTSAALMFVVQASTTTSGLIDGDFLLGEK